MPLLNTFTLNLDLKDSNYISGPAVTASDSVRFVINVTDDGLLFDLTGMTLATIAHTRPDGVVVLKSGTKTGTNQLTFDLGTTEISILGRVDAKVQIYDATNRVSTLDFGYTVTKDPSGESYVPSEDEETLIEIVLGEGPQVIADAKTATTNANNAATAANAATTNVGTAITQANAARDGANAAKTNADTAATNATNAATAANTAKTNADTATTNATNAATAANTAKTNADTATTQANAARDGANTAKTNADTATTQANAARDAANTAKTNADTATTNATNATATANAATTQANSARDSANTAATDANIAKTNADIATANTNAVANATSHKGTYNNAIAYVPNNIVYYDGGSYMNVVASTGVDPSDTSKWKQIADKGDKGDQGLKGDTGDTGDKGDNGVIMVSDGMTSTTPTSAYPTGLSLAQVTTVDGFPASGLLETMKLSDVRIYQTLFPKGTENYFYYRHNVGASNAWSTFFSTLGAKGDKGDQGLQGTPGDGFVYKGAYSGSQTYQVRDVVVYNGSAYVNINTSTGVLPTDLGYWDVFAQKGVDGTGAVVSLASTSNDLTVGGTIQVPDLSISSTLKDSWSDKYTKVETDSKISQATANIQWKPAVANFAAIASTYPSPQDGWTVNVNDTDYTYRYTGSAWVAISANSIPNASAVADGKMTIDDYLKLQGVSLHANYVLPSGTGTNGNIRIDYVETPVYVHPTGDGNNHIPTGGSAATFLKWSSSGVAIWAKPTLSGLSDVSLLAPQANHYLKYDGSSWINSAIANASVSAAGLMSSSDKTKLDGYTPSSTVQFGGVNFGDSLNYIKQVAGILTVYGDTGLTLSGGTVDVSSSGLMSFNGLTMEFTANEGIGFYGQVNVTGTLGATDQIYATVANGTSPFVVTSTTKVVNLNADMVDNLHSATAATALTLASRDGSGNLYAVKYVSSAAQGTAPLQVTSTTVVPNLNADMVDGFHADAASTASTIAVRDSGGDVSARRFVTNVATGSSPFTVLSTTVVTNLNADMVDGRHMDQDVRTTDAPFFSGLTIEDQVTLNGNMDIYGPITSHVISGNAPFVVASTTMVTNLNAQYVGGVPMSLGGNNVSTNIAIGANALPVNTAGNQSIAIGRDTLALQTTALQNVAIGSGALKTIVSTNFNVAVGAFALRDSTGGNNVAVGSSALANGAGGSNNTAVGKNALTNDGTFSNITGIGANADVTAANQVQLGDSATVTYVYGTVQNRSDERDKAEIRDTVLGLDFIQKLRPVDFKWNYREDYNTKDDYGNVTFGENDGSKIRVRYHHGLVAQEVEALIEETGIDFGGYQDHSLCGGKEVKSIGYDELISPMIKAIQELKAEFDAFVSQQK